jgi:hypothetical protein
MPITVKLPRGTARATYACVPPRHSTTGEWAVSVLSVTDEITGEDINDDLSDEDFATVEYTCERDMYEHSDAMVEEWFRL